MPKYVTKKGRVFVINASPDEYADALEEKLRAIRDNERRGDAGESRILQGMTALGDEEIRARDESWDRYAARLVREVREAVPA